MTNELEMQIKYLQSRLKDNHYDDGLSNRKIEDTIALLSKLLDVLTLV